MSLVKLKYYVNNNGDIKLIRHTVNPKAVLREIGDEAVLLDSDGGIYYALNNSALFIWRQIASNLSPDEIILSMTNRWALTHSQAKDDYQEVVSSLVVARLLRA
jgi:hypothetical protein